MPAGRKTSKGGSGDPAAGVDARPTNPMIARLKSLVFRLLGKEPEAVVVTFLTGDETLARGMAAEILELVPDRRHFTVEFQRGSTWTFPMALRATQRNESRHAPASHTSLQFSWVVRGRQTACLPVVKPQ